MARTSFSRRTIALMVAIVLAAVATVVLVSYVQGAEDRAAKGIELVEAFVAKDDIPQGFASETASSQGLIGRAKIPRKTLAAGAITSLDQIKSKVAAVRIFKGEQILVERFVTPSQAAAATGFSIPAGRQAMSVEVGIPPGVAGFVRPGDHVSIIASLAQAGGQKVQYLLQDIQVLAVGERVITTTTSGNQPATTNKTLFTLALVPAQAEKLAFAIFQGELYFTLLPPGQGPAKTSGRTTNNAFQ